MSVEEGEGSKIVRKEAGKENRRKMQKEKGRRGRK